MMRLVAGVLALVLCACGAPAENAGPQLDVRRIRITTEAEPVPLHAEIATTAEERSQGLMERAQLPQDTGMLFVYSEPQPSYNGFWMYRTRIPLDIAFLDARGRILAIQSMEPCESDRPRQCPVYRAGVEYSAALEVNRGFFARHGIGPGDRVHWPAQ